MQLILTIFIPFNSLSCAKEVIKDKVVGSVRIIVTSVHNCP